MTDLPATWRSRQRQHDCGGWWFSQCCCLWAAAAVNLAMGDVVAYLSLTLSRDKSATRMLVTGNTMRVGADASCVAEKSRRLRTKSWKLPGPCAQHTLSRHETGGSVNKASVFSRYIHQAMATTVSEDEVLIECPIAKSRSQ